MYYFPFVIMSRTFNLAFDPENLVFIESENFCSSCKTVYFRTSAPSECIRTGSTID